MKPMSEELVCRIAQCNAGMLIAQLISVADARFGGYLSLTKIGSTWRAGLGIGSNPLSRTSRMFDSPNDAVRAVLRLVDVEPCA